jgi:hypothetical protein
MMLLYTMSIHNSFAQLVSNADALRKTNDVGNADFTGSKPDDVIVSTDSSENNGGLRTGLSPTGVWFGTLSPLALSLYTSGIARVTIQPTGIVNFLNSIDIKGTTTTEVLTITGGADIAEPFELSDEAKLTEGTVVIIDETQAGKLKISDKAYDTCVAGIVSGAGGIRPGLTLQQNEKLSGSVYITLVGRIFVRATATNGRIRPGDLLTTSNIPGHAMKVKDTTLSQGAIIGKALGSLNKGEGLVLVLVNLQ